MSPPQTGAAGILPDGLGAQAEEDGAPSVDLLLAARSPLTVDEIAALIVRQTIRGTPKGFQEYAAWVYGMAEALHAEGRRRAARREK